MLFEKENRRIFVCPSRSVHLLLVFLHFILTIAFTPGLSKWVFKNLGFF